MEKEIEQLKKDIKYEEEMYEIALEHPTNTEQYRNALRRQRERIRDMKDNLFILIDCE